MRGGLGQLYIGLCGPYEGLAFTLSEVECSSRIWWGGVICDLCFKGMTLAFGFCVEKRLSEGKGRSRKTGYEANKISSHNGNLKRSDSFSSR